MNTESKKVLVGEGVKFERIRRITGYLVGTVDRFNNAKRAEVEDRSRGLGDVYKRQDPISAEAFGKGGKSVGVLPPFFRKAFPSLPQCSLVLAKSEVLV